MTGHAGGGDASPPGIIVAGMHRSSTSLVTSVIEAAGFWLPDEQLPARPDNPKGYWEDLRMHWLHRHLLQHYETGWDYSPRLRKLRRKDLPIPPHLQDEAAELVRLYDEHVPWTWKNPRATLFLEEWGRRFPDAVVVICLRRPDAVVDSMLRRRNWMRIHGRGPWVSLRRLARGLSVWRSYNMVADRFARRHPERTITIRIPEDLRVLEQASGTKLFDPKMLRPPRSKVRVPAMLAVRCRWLYSRMAGRSNPEKLVQLLAEARVSPRDQVRGEVRDDTGSMTTKALLGVGGSTMLAVVVNAAAAFAC